MGPRDLRRNHADSATGASTSMNGRKDRLELMNEMFITLRTTNVKQLRRRTNAIAHGVPAVAVLAIDSHSIVGRSTARGRERAKSKLF